MDSLEPLFSTEKEAQASKMAFKSRYVAPEQRFALATPDQNNYSVDRFLGNLFAPNKVLRVRYDASNRRASITLAADVTDSSPVRIRRVSLKQDASAWPEDRYWLHS